MNKDDYYSTGQFMSLTHVTKKTLRYYDEHNILKPSFTTETGARYYSNNDLAKMQQILLLKYLGFSLADIREITINNADSEFLETSLNLQQELVEDQIEKLQVVSQAISETKSAIAEKKDINWNTLLESIHSATMDQSLKTQYQNASNISARIHLHSLYSNNKEGWFPWIFNNCNIKGNINVLEIGCGDGTFWQENIAKLPPNIHITVSDISDGMLRDARRNIGTDDERFNYSTFDCADIPYKDNHFDLVIANHVLFYCSDISKVCSEVKRVLKADGTFVCSTYGPNHMKEVSELVTAFDDRIILSAEKLYNSFGRENGKAMLTPYFQSVNWRSYEDYLSVPDSAPLISYILSCHGNQTQYIIDHYKEFQLHVKKYIGAGLHITKDSGIFICKK